MSEKPITLTGYENKQIVSIIHLPDKKTSKTVIMCHGSTVDKTLAFTVKLARKLCKSGANVVRFDFTGSGDSEGEFEDQTFSSQMYDLDKVIEYVKEKLGEEIIVLGQSYGGFIALAKAAEDSRIKAVISLSTPVDKKKYWPKSKQNKINAKGYEIDDWLFKWTKKRMLDELKNSSIVARLSKIKVPILIINQDKDWLVPLEDAETIYEKVKDPKEKFILDGNDHIFADLKQRELLFEKIVKWAKNLEI